MEVVSESKVSFRDIFVSKAWTDFYEKNKDRIRPAVIDSIEKILLCGSGELGYGVLRCKCGHEEFVYFTCKCRFCSKCGKMACDNWMKKVIGWALPNIKYKHVVFTIPQELRIFLMMNRKSGLDVLFKASTNSLLYVFEKCFKCKPGIITVMHTFGGDVKWNPHIHVIITQGGLSLDGKKWSNHSKIPEAFIKASWKRNVVTALRSLAKEIFCNDWKQYNAFNSVLNVLYKKKWYVNLGRTLKSLEFTVRYNGRYAKRPVLAETRLESFDGENVSFSFKDKLTKKVEIYTMTAEEFIGRMIRHIPNKGHRMIRYSGLFASRIKSKMLLVIQNLLSKGQQAIVYVKQIPLSWREMKIKCTGVDPYECKKCGKLMELAELVIALKSGGTKTIFLKEVDCSP